MADDLEELRKKRMQKHMQQQQNQQAQAQKQQQQQMEEIIKQIINQVLTPQAKERLGNIRAADPEYARQIEMVLIQLYQQGRLQDRLTDKQLKNILADISKRKQKDINIKRKRK